MIAILLADYFINRQQVQNTFSLSRTRANLGPIRWFIPLYVT